MLDQSLYRQEIIISQIMQTVTEDFKNVMEAAGPFSSSDEATAGSNDSKDWAGYYSDPKNWEFVQEDALFSLEGEDLENLSSCVKKQVEEQIETSLETPEVKAKTQKRIDDCVANPKPWIHTAESILRNRKARGLPKNAQMKCHACVHKWEEVDPEACEWYSVRKALISLGIFEWERLEELPENKYKSKEALLREVRFYCYCKYTWMRHGLNGMDQKRYPLPVCVEAGIKNEFPDPRGKYSFFKLGKQATLPKTEKSKK